MVGVVALQTTGSIAELVDRVSLRHRTFQCSPRFSPTSQDLIQPL
jgi:hypothetical protein